MNKTIEFHDQRAVITLAGPERKNLLQGIITNDVNRLKESVAIYSALLSPQGKFLHDFFLVEKDNIIYLDCNADRADDLLRRLLMYRLRSDVEIINQSEKFHVITSLNEMTDEPLSFKDPRHPSMGYRAITAELPPSNSNTTTYHERRIKLGIAESTLDFIADKSTVLEGHFEAINGVDFEKGCYVGQEVTARMKYRGKIKKLMLPVLLSGPAPEFGSEITDENGNKVGDLRSHCEKNAIALFRIDKINFGAEYDCHSIKVTPFAPNFYKETENE